MGLSHKKIARHPYWTLPPAIASICALLPTTVLARAGGGGGFSGGGGVSGGGGGGGGGDLIAFLLWLLITHPLIGVPVIIIVIALFIISSKSGYSAHVSSTIRRGYATHNSQKLTVGLDRLRERDPAFDLDAFTKRCMSALPKVQTAWSNQDMTPARHLVSDGIYERFQLQLKMQKGSCLRNVVRDVNVISVKIVGMQSDNFFDALHVRIDATAVDYTEDIRTGKRVHGNTTPEAFTEIWSFLRRPGAKTLSTPGLIEGFCPNCGTPLKISDSTKCPSCQAIINSGEYDWVLSEITQMEVWRDTATRPIPGLAEMRKKDPAFNVQHIEDKLSVIFWHHCAATFFADEKYLKKLTLPEYIKSNASDFMALKNGKHRFFADTSIGSVDLAGIELADEDDDFDRVHVQVKWSGHLEECEIPSLIKPAYSRSQIKSQDFILVRRKDALTSRVNTLTSAHCPGCGAPQTINTNGVCEYCGLAQNDGSGDWVLSDIQPFFTFAVKFKDALKTKAACASTDIFESRLSKRENEQLLQCAAAVMLADGIIDPKEEKALKKMAGRRGITDTRLKELIENLRINGIVKLPESLKGQEGHEFTKALVQMCLADGNVSRSEKELIKSLVKHMSYKDVDIDRMIATERNRLYQQSKQVIKTAKGV